MKKIIQFFFSIFYLVFPCCVHCWSSFEKFSLGPHSLLFWYMEFVWFRCGCIRTNRISVGGCLWTVSTTGFPTGKSFSRHLCLQLILSNDRVFQWHFSSISVSTTSFRKSFTVIWFNFASYSSSDFTPVYPKRFYMHFNFHIYNIRYEKICRWLHW